MRWDYRDDASRYRIYQVMAALNKLKRDYPTFQTTDFSLDVGGTGKRIHLYHPDMNVVITGNFDVVGFDMVPGFPNTGTWYDYFTGEAIEVTDLNASIYHNAGDYHLYTDQPLPTPELGVGIEEMQLASSDELQVYPNPSSGDIHITWTTPVSVDLALSVLDASGRKIADLPTQHLKGGKNIIRWDGSLPNGSPLIPGTYIIRAEGNGSAMSATLIRN